MVITDLTEQEELFNYDTLIFCPNNFSLVFHIPNRGRQAERTFDIHFTDSSKSYHVYLTHMLFETPFIQKEKHNQRDSSNLEHPWLIIAVVVTSAAFLLFFLNLTYAHLEYTKLIALQKNKHIPNERTAISNRTHASKLSKKQYVFVVSYVGFRVLYSIFFTFTVFFGILGLVLQNNVLQLSGIQEFQKRKYNETRSLALEIEKYGQDELLRQAELVTNMQGACSNYIEELFEAMLQQVDNITLQLHHTQMYSEASSITSLMNSWYQSKASHYQQQMDTFTKSYRTNFSRDVKPSLRAYHRYLDAIYKNAWFQFPQLLFNNSHLASTHHSRGSSPYLNGLHVNFGSFLHVEEIEDVQIWSTQFWQR